MENGNQAYKAITRICLNNWHYIDRKTLSLNKSINFFTGHSGSGKSTVIDAIQIVLYANTDGRGFFNKAAADDSDRNLIEYLRGMINIGENNQAAYKRNHNFSTTIVLELQQTATKETECIGVVFDVDTATNEVNRQFFWHTGELFANEYRTDGRTMAISELRAYLQHNYEKEAYFYTSNNERFRRNLYDIYLGGLDMEKFPRLFKRAIPFRMNVRLEDFVKEYICMEQDIHMEDMKESVILYGRMCRKIENTRTEIEELEKIKDAYEAFRQGKQQEKDYLYRLEKLEILQLKEALQELQERIEAEKSDITAQRESLQELEKLRMECTKEYDEINRQILGSGYTELEKELQSLNELLHRLERSRNHWQNLALALAKWEDEEVASNQVIWDIEKFKDGSINGEELLRLSRNLTEVHEEVEKQRQEAASEARGLKKEIDILERELAEIRLGKKAYPRELEDAKRLIQRGLYDIYGKTIPVHILADVIDIRDEKWRNAIEGYLGFHKLSLLVEPKYVHSAMEVYETLDNKKYWSISVVDTEKLMGQEHKVREKALAEEIVAEESFVQAFVQYLLGNVIKCDSVEALRRERIGVTADCMLYQNYQLRRMNPENYTRRAFIGEKSMRKRQKELQERYESYCRQKEEFDTVIEDARRLLEYEYLSGTTEEYLELQRDMTEEKTKIKRRQELEQQLKTLGADTVDILKEALEQVRNKQKSIEDKMDKLKIKIHDRQQNIQKYKQQNIDWNEELLQREREVSGSKMQEENFGLYINEQKNPSYMKLIQQTNGALEKTREDNEKAKRNLVDTRTEYLQKHPSRNFSASEDNNEAYEQLLAELSCDRILDYEKMASEQAKVAIEHFKEDFVYKIRSAIKEAYIRRDELNRIIKNLNFGKDRYQFKITRNKGIDGEYYDMFMDESLEIHPDSLSDSVENQVNLFAMEHENRYGNRINELIHIFIPPENADAKTQEEARLNMEKYADYRTYLSFEMEQIVEGEEKLVIGLSKMIKKNSGGEGQNPLYVALLASFAQAYRVNLSPKLQRRPTIRLVVLDEAFSKMDAEKVASCIELIRGLGFQAIISATNDKIQNYLENVDKTFVYANPNKKSISIQEFEKADFIELSENEV
ncbi:MAG: AAA family ATPase [Lachnospiraceae bacterium]|nr:AAA family ATPase [Lachnospiraceae bacterium]